MSSPPGRPRAAPAAYVLALSLAGCDPAPAPRPAEESRSSASDRREPSTASSEHALDDLEALGYLGSEDETGGAVGLLVHEPELAFAGLNFYSSGHAAEAVLMDMRSHVLQRWALDFARVGLALEVDRPGSDRAHARTCHELDLRAAQLV